MRTLGVVVVVGVLLLSGCSGGEDGANAPATVAGSPAAANAPTAATDLAPDDGADALRAAVQAYSDAFLTGEGEAAYALLSQRCQDRNSADDFSAMVVTAGELYGSPLVFTSYEAQISGALARVSYTYDVASINQDSEPWVREEGNWREDDC